MKTSSFITYLFDLVITKVKTTSLQETFYVFKKKKKKTPKNGKTKK